MKVEGMLSGQVSLGILKYRSSLTLQIPQATVHSSLVAEAWLAWHSMPIFVSIRSPLQPIVCLQRSMM